MVKAHSVGDRLEFEGGVGSQAEKGTWGAERRGLGESQVGKPGRTALTRWGEENII